MKEFYDLEKHGITGRILSGRIAVEINAILGSGVPRDGSMESARERLFPPGPVVANPVYLVTYVRSVTYFSARKKAASISGIPLRLDGRHSLVGA